MLRVIGGDFKGRALRAPRGDRTRPTSARAREALFGALTPVLAGARVLDLFCGTGALGIEALSRGAAHVEFVESSRAALAALRANLETLGLLTRARIHPRDVRAVVAGMVRGGRQFDLVVADPPYDDELIGRFIGSGALRELVAVEGRLVIERRRDVAAVEMRAGLKLLASREYGKTVFDHYGREDGPAPPRDDA